jgi:hypothetical protein
LPVAESSRTAATPWVGATLYRGPSSGTDGRPNSAAMASGFDLSVKRPHRNFGIVTAAPAGKPRPRRPISELMFDDLCRSASRPKPNIRVTSRNVGPWVAMEQIPEIAALYGYHLNGPNIDHLPRVR